MSSQRAALALSLVDGVGPVRFRELVHRFGTPRDALNAVAGAERRTRALSSADQLLRELEHCGAWHLPQGSVEYPSALLELPDPPSNLFAIGAVESLAPPAVAIVGTRSATAYGERVTRELSGALARAGVSVISGLARGIDAAAHRAALASRGRTVAVLGTGVDIVYPASHRALYREIAERGLLLSEERPGDRATAGSFPKRNRIIAALASVTIVVEAGARSGALITANSALDLGRTVAAVPGPIDAPQSAGTNELLRDGAIVIASVDDALALFGRTVRTPPIPSFTAPAERAVWDALGAGALHLDALASASALPARECLAAVTTLELAGAVECALTGEIRRR